MNHNEIILINLYISLRLAYAKQSIFRQKNCEVPQSLIDRIKQLETAIAEREVPA